MIVKNGLTILGSTMREIDKHGDSTSYRHVKAILISEYGADEFERHKSKIQKLLGSELGASNRYRLDNMVRI